MDAELDLAKLVHRGGIFKDIDGCTPEEIYKQVTFKLDLPTGISSEQVYYGLCNREKVMSTAVGDGLAIPHMPIPVIKSNEDERICVVYPKNPIMMDSPDERKVYAMLILLSKDANSHVKMLGGLVEQFKKPTFKRLLSQKASEAQLLMAIRDLA